MTPKVLYRTAAVLLLLFAALHTVGFTRIDPSWRIDELIAKLRSAIFLAQGQTRSYWEFYVGLGYSVSVWQVMAALVAWELGRTTAALPLLRWGLVGAMAATAWLSWRYFFPAPLVFSLLITACLAWAAWRVRSNVGVRQQPQS